MYQLQVSTRVHRQLAEVLTWYDERDAGLADQFLEDLERTLTLLRDRPRMYPLSYNHTRHVRSVAFLTSSSTVKPGQEFVSCR